MKKRMITRALAVLAAVAMLFSLSVTAMAAEPGDAYPEGAWLVNLSNNGADGASGFSTFAVNHNNPDQIAVGWRVYGLPTNTKAAIGDWVGDFHLSVSDDGGKTFTEVDMMPYVRAVQKVDGLPEEEEYSLWWCNGPWATYDGNGTLYCGAICYTAKDLSDPEHPRQGRCLVMTSTDNGKTFNDATFGMRLDNFSDTARALTVSNPPPWNRPSTTGIPLGEPGTDPWHTPWDGNFGIASANSDLFISVCGGNIVASHDGAQTYEKVYGITYPEGWSCGSGTPAIDGSTIVVPITVNASPDDSVEPGSMGVVISSDDGATWSEPMIAIAGSEVNNTTSVRQIRSPIGAVSPAEPGHWAFCTYSPDHLQAKVVYTEDAGQTWKSAETPALDGYDDYTEAREVAVGYTTGGEIVVTWRGQKTWANYYVFAALLGEDGQFAKTVLAAPEISTYPYETTQGNYCNNQGAGDYCSFAGGNNDYCIVDFPYSADGVALDQFLAFIPLDAMR